MQTYLTENNPKISRNDTIRVFARSQIKQFLFSGHDTTSSTTCYLFYVLSIHAEVKQRVELEHNQVLGGTLEGKITQIKEKPYLLNQLPLTMAVLKETMRHYPVASSLRGGEPGFSARDAEGRSLPTDGFLVWAVSQPLHRDPDYWPQPEIFLPDR